MDYLKTLRDLFAFMKNTRLSETQMRELQNHIAPQRFDRFPTDSKVLIAKLAHTPQNKSNGHGERFS